MPPTNFTASEQDINYFNTLAPLAPVNLLRAGVPPSEVVWFRELEPDKQMAALSTTRGQLLLDQVRSFMAGGQRHLR
jgi:hypothetical protein